MFIEVTFVYSKDCLKIGIIGTSLIVSFKCGKTSGLLLFRK